MILASERNIYFFSLKLFFCIWSRFDITCSVSVCSSFFQTQFEQKTNWAVGKFYVRNNRLINWLWHFCKWFMSVRKDMMFIWDFNTRSVKSNWLMYLLVNEINVFFLSNLFFAVLPTDLNEKFLVKYCIS